MSDASGRYAEFMAAWVGGVRRMAGLVVGLGLALTAASLWYVIANLSISTDTSDMLSPELEFMRQSDELSRAFPQFSDTVVVVVDGETPDMAFDAAARLAGGLRQRPELFGEVYDLADHPFFRANGLLYKDKDQLAELADRLAEAQPFLGALWRDPSLAGLFRMLSLAVDEAITGGGLPMEIDRVLERMAETVEATAAGRFARLSWWRLMEGDGAGETRRVFMIQPVVDYGSLNPAGRAMDEIRALAKSLGLTPDRGVSVRLTGSAALAQEELESVEQGMGLAGVLSLTLVASLLFIGLRSGKMALATVATLVMGLCWTAGFAVLAVGSLNLISVAFAVLFIGLSVDFGIHLALRYREGVDRGLGQDQAMRDAARGAGGALTLCAVGAAIAFYAFLPTDYIGLAELGLIAGTGMFIAFFANMTLLPALLVFLPARPAPVAKGGFRLSGDWTTTHAKIIVGAALVLGVGAAALLPLAHFDFDPLNLKDPDTESVSTLFDLMSDEDANPYAITILTPDLEEATRLASSLAGLEEVESTRSLADFVAHDQDEKLEIIADMGMFLLPSLSGTREPDQADFGVTADAMAELRQKLGRLAELDGQAGPAAARMERALAGMPREGLDELRAGLLESLDGRLESLRDSLNASPFGINDLPPELKDREVAADGRVRLAVYPREDLRQRAALISFIEAVRQVAPSASGEPVVILEAGNTVLKAFVQAGITAIFLIGLVLALLLRRISEVVLVFAPLVLAALLTVAVSVIMGMAFNFANVIVLPLLFGLGVAGGIHLVLRGGRESVMETSTPRAVVFSALTTIGSFGSIALSSHPGTASMGILLTIALAMTLVCTLVVLPSLMALVPVRD